MTSSRNHIFFVLFSLFLVSIATGPLGELIDYSRSGDEVAASHIVLVPFVTAFLLLTGRRRIFERVRFSVLPGATLAAVGGAVFMAYRSVGDGFEDADRLAISTASVVLVWLGGFLAFYGPAAFRRGLFPLLFLGFAIPIPTAALNAVVAALQHGSAETAFLILKMTGTPVYREGFVFAMPDLVIEVAPECSGIRSGIGMFILSLLAGQQFLQSWLNRSILVVASIAIGILKNAIRIDTLSLLTIHVDPGIIDGRLHHEGGTVFFGIGLLLVYPVLLALVRRERSKRASRSVPGREPTSGGLVPAPEIMTAAVGDSSGKRRGF